MKTFAFGFFLQAVLCVASLFGAPLVKPKDWQLDRFARIEGNLLIVEVPKGETDGAARATIELPNAGRGVEMSIRCRGTNITRPEQNWLGTKFMLHFVDADGNECWPGAPQQSGSFDWREMRLAAGTAKGSRDGKATLTLGLQSASGTIVFDLDSLELKTNAALWEVPAEDAEYRCLYSEALAKASRKRGVMLPGGPCKEDDFRTLREWGATLARYQMVRNWGAQGDNRDLAEYDRWLDGKLDHLDRDVLPWAERYGIAIVVDLHVAPGGRNGSDHAMFYEARYGEHFIECWRRIARRFKGRGAIYGYDLINEPCQDLAGVPDGDYWNLQRRAAEAIREIDPDVPIILEANGWDSPSGFAALRPLRMTNVIYQVHMYRPMEFTHQGVNGIAPKGGAKYPDAGKGWNRDFLARQLAEVRAFQQAHGAKIYLGEFSAITWADGAADYLRDVISLCEEYGWDWTYHAFREWGGWSVEHESDAEGHFVPSSDNPRRKALLDGLKK